MKCAIHQPQFLPWLGYFHKISTADIFVFLDNVQFKKNEFQNRNKIRIVNQSRWITIPVSFSFGDTILQTMISYNRNWQKKLYLTIKQNYKKTPFFNEYKSELINLLNKKWNNLAELNQASIKWILKCININTPIFISSHMPVFSNEPTQRIIDICNYLGADTYLSGSGGLNYLNTEKLQKAGIKVEFQNFLHPVYKQWHNNNECEFISHLSVIDALFNCGDNISEIFNRSEK